MRILVTGGTGVLGTALLPLLAADGHVVAAPGRDELDLFHAAAVTRVVAGCDAVVHLATRIPPPDRMGDAAAWAENDRLRAEASGVLVDAALAAATAVYVQPTVTFVYPQVAHVDESTPLGEVRPFLRSALVAESHARRFADAHRRGVVLRLGLLDGPGTWSADPVPEMGATLHVEDAGTALLAALDAPSGIYNVCRDGERVDNTKFKQTTGWSPSR